MTLVQYLFIVGLVVIGIAMIPWSVERAVDKRWGEIRQMFDRALMHGGSLDTLTKALKATSEESRIKAARAEEVAEGALKGMGMLHDRVKALEEHPLLRPLGGRHSHDGGGRT